VKENVLIVEQMDIGHVIVQKVEGIDASIVEIRGIWRATVVNGGISVGD